jgi:hypothetical protein
MPAGNVKENFGSSTPLRQPTMALRELPSSLRRLALRDARPITAVSGNCWRRYASAEAVAAAPAPQEVSEDFRDLESKSSLFTAFSPDEKIKAYDPIKRTQGRKRELPPSRYALETTQWPEPVANILQISIPVSKILSWTSASSSTSSKIRPFFQGIYTWPIFLHSTRTNLPIHNCPGSDGLDLCPQTTWNCHSTETRPFTNMG